MFVQPHRQKLMETDRLRLLRSIYVSFSYAPLSSTYKFLLILFIPLRLLMTPLQKIRLDNPGYPLAE